MVPLSRRGSGCQLGGWATAGIGALIVAAVTIDACTDRLAHNFGTEDEECQAAVPGCTDSASANYKAASCTAKEGWPAPSGVVCGQPASGAVVCPDNTEHCVFTAGAGSVGSCAPTSHSDCAAAVSNATQCQALRCTYAPAANVDDGSCIGACQPDLSWADDEGSGCADYWLTYCGYDESERRCPTTCGTYVNTNASNGCDGHPNAAAGNGCGGGGLVCSVGVRPGCDGVPGSSLIEDACGVCGGDGQACLSCAAAASHFCTRTVSITTAMGQSTDADCRTHIAGRGGRALYGSVFFRAEDCGDTFY
eukprot:COSAG05_NODE_4241_length_1608_cov_4.532140_1_plen_306_part_10